MRPSKGPRRKDNLLPELELLFKAFLGVILVEVCRPLQQITTRLDRVDELLQVFARELARQLRKDEAAED